MGPLQLPQIHRASHCAREAGIEALHALSRALAHRLFCLRYVASLTGRDQSVHHGINLLLDDRLLRHDGV